MENTYRSLSRKLSMLSEGEQIGLTPEEAAIYGVDYAQEWPEDENIEKWEEDGQ